MQLMKHGVSFSGSDFVAIANAYGGHGTLVSSSEELQDELNQAWKRSTFTVLACAIEKDAYNEAF